MTQTLYPHMNKRNKKKKKKNYFKSLSFMRLKKPYIKDYVCSFVCFPLFYCKTVKNLLVILTHTVVQHGLWKKKWRAKSALSFFFKIAIIFKSCHHGSSRNIVSQWNILPFILAISVGSLSPSKSLFYFGSWYCRAPLLSWQECANLPHYWRFQDRIVDICVNKSLR
jgi:hypothetical protein